MDVGGGWTFCCDAFNPCTCRRRGGGGGACCCSLLLLPPMIVKRDSLTAFFRDLDLSMAVGFGRSNRRDTRPSLLLITVAVVLVVVVFGSLL